MSKASGKSSFPQKGRGESVCKGMSANCMHTLQRTRKLVGLEPVMGAKNMQRMRLERELDKAGPQRFLL